ncbi:MAG: cyanophycinase [Bacteroidales bacterium]
MKNIYWIIPIILFLSFHFSSCSPETEGEIEETPKGKLYIIGGGKRPPEMVKQMIDLAGVEQGGYIVVLPMSSYEVDTAAYWAMKQFKDQGVKNITWFNFEKGRAIEQHKLDSIANASMIYISGGDQNRFMDIVAGTPIAQAIHNAYANGAVIAGTSAGAAVQSERMITGNQLKNPDMRGYQTIQPNNIETTEGLGLIETAIIDQHFIWRERVNRLISVCIENPEVLAIGIDESTAILVEADSATVYGTSQVLVLNASNATIAASDSLLGAKNIRMDLYLPGQSFSIVP